MTGVSAEAQRAAVALCADTGFLRPRTDNSDLWRSAAVVEYEYISDAVVNAAVEAGWFKIFSGEAFSRRFRFAAVTAAGYAALEKAS